MTRRILIAPDKFKGSLTAGEAAAALAAGLRRACPDAELDLCPIADGGEGFMETLATALRGRWISCPAVDGLNRPIVSRYVLAETPEGPVAVMEMAETAGLWRLGEDERDPLTTTTRGTGMQIAHAIREHAPGRIILGIGGSATNDGGSGMAAALGVKFLTADGSEIEPTPARLAEIAQVDAAGLIAMPEIIAACDVDNPLLGEMGATAVFSTQKGSTPESRPVLEAALERLVRLSGGEAAAATSGAGAAGGLGFGLLHFAGARLQSGFDLLADLLALKSRIAAADHVVTGEGALDHQSLAGKGPVGLARLAAAAGVPITAFCGVTDEAARASGLFQAIHALSDTGHPVARLMKDAGPLLAEMAAAAEFPRHSPNLHSSIMKKTAFITEAEAIKEDFKGRTNFWMCRPEITNTKDIQICRAALPAGEGHNFHHHPELEEVIYVLEGEVEQWVEQEMRMLKAGEVAHIPAGVVHATFNPTAADAVILAILSPAACEGPFMVDVSGEEPWKSLRA